VQAKVAAQAKLDAEQAAREAEATAAQEPAKA